MQINSFSNNYHTYLVVLKRAFLSTLALSLETPFDLSAGICGKNSAFWASAILLILLSFSCSIASLFSVNQGAFAYSTSMPLAASFSSFLTFLGDGIGGFNCLYSGNLCGFKCCLNISCVLWTTFKLPPVLLTASMALAVAFEPSRDIYTPNDLSFSAPLPRNLTPCFILVMTPVSYRIFMSMTLEGSRTSFSIK